MTSKFNVGLVFEQLDLRDATLDRLYRVLPDAVLADMNGVVTVQVLIDAADAESAALALVEAVEGVASGAVAVRVDQDLVAIPDIAQRVDRSRESVRLLVEGKRGPGGFPRPIGVVGDGIRVWPWAPIVDWFQSAMGEDLDEAGIPPEIAAAVDARLAARRPRLDADKRFELARR